MQRFRIFRMKEQARSNFRWAAHTLGTAVVKPKDYDEAGEIEAKSAYAAWDEQKAGQQKLEVGDLLMTEGGVLLIYKYVGFEEARWMVRDAAGTGESSATVEAGMP